VVEIARHSMKGVVETENCVKIQRSARRSYLTTASPSLFV